MDSITRDAILKARSEAFEALCPPLYRDTDGARLPQKQLGDVLSWTYGPKGLFLVGPARTGKTRCAWLLLKRMMEQGRSVRAFDGVGWQLAVSRAFGSPDDTEGWFRMLVEPDILFIDDLFKGKLTEAQELAVHGVLERRSSQLQPVIATSNTMSAKDLVARMTEAGIKDRAEAIVGRIREFCKTVRFGGKA